jgi:hypothetical protein
MEINLYFVVGITILAIALVVFLIQKNRKDEKELESFLNNEYGIEDTEEDEPNNLT